jgi:uncharacterized protein YgiM (DUF1202 family)
VPETANVRKSAEADADLVAQVTKGEKFFVIKFADGWAGGKTSSGKWGWVREDLLTFSHDQGREIAAETGHGSSSSSSDSVHHPVAWVVVVSANVRSGPGLGFDKYGSLTRGARVYILERRGEWLRCKTPGGAGWLSDKMITYDAHLGPHVEHGGSLPKAYIDGEVVNLRKRPTTDSDLVARVRDGQTVWLLERHSDWAKVKVNNGSTGWVERDCLKADENSSAGTRATEPGVFPSPVKGHRFTTMTGWIGDDECNVRDSASADGDVKFQLSKGDKVTVVALDGPWCKIRTGDGQFGWVSGFLMAWSAPGKGGGNGQSGEATIGWVSRPSINLRSGPGDNYPRTGTLALSTQVYIVARQGDWYKVAMDNREVGWVGDWLIDTRSDRSHRGGPGSGGSVNLCPPSLVRVGSESGSEAGRGLVATAMRYLGHRYVYGAEGPDEFDCSGLMAYVLGQHGIATERTAAEQFHQGSPVLRGDLEPGDLVFFGRSGISHVAMYIGGGRIIHAENVGSGVTITPLDMPWYACRYVGARRMR